MDHSEVAAAFDVVLEVRRGIWKITPAGRAYLAAAGQGDRSAVS